MLPAEANIAKSRMISTTKLLEIGTRLAYTVDACILGVIAVSLDLGPLQRYALNCRRHTRKHTVPNSVEGTMFACLRRVRDLTSA